jgi:hypothetical protein
MLNVDLNLKDKHENLDFKKIFKICMIFALTIVPKQCL